MFWGIIFTIFSGLFFLIGIVMNNKDKTSNFTTSLAFVVLFGLLLFDLLPEMLEAKNYYLIIFCLIGFFSLIILDKLIPHHHHDHKEEQDDKIEHVEHLNHVGVITIIALTIHNMIEGLSLYSVTLSSIKSGLLMMIGISLHNIPLGFQIGASIKDKKKNILLIAILCMSSFLGALTIILFGTIKEEILGYLLSLTFGMLLYILIFELFHEVLINIKRKETKYGILCGIVILVLINLL